MNRREWLEIVGCGALASMVARGAGLPLDTTGLEHYGYTVPEPEKTARFYGKIFDPQLFQERDPPPRFYVRLGTAYLAFGGNPQTAATPFIDHFCALTQGYGPGELRKMLEAAGVKMGAGALGMATDPDGLRLQTLGVPGGLARTIIPGPRITTDDALLAAVGTSHVVLHVTNLDASVEHYKKIFGPEGKRMTKPERAWFQVAKTRLVLEQVASGEKPSIHHIAIKIAGFQKNAVVEKLKRAGADMVTAGDKSVMFRDPHGLAMELVPEV